VLERLPDERRRSQSREVKSAHEYPLVRCERVRVIGGHAAAAGGSGKCLKGRKLRTPEKPGREAGPRAVIGNRNALA